MPALLRLLLGIGVIAAVVKVVEEYMIGKRKVFVSFDYENDKRYKFMLQAWDANKEFDFVFNDASSGEVRSNDVGRVKAALTSKIRAADMTLVIVGKEANRPHKDRALIGYRNWINFEVAKSKDAGNGIVAVKLDRGFKSPEELTGAGAKWAMTFTQNAITKALRDG